MQALVITATLETAVAFERPIHLDALLAAAVALRDGLTPAAHEGEMIEIDIPLARSSCGRYHLASVGLGEVDCHELKYINRRFPISEAQWLGDEKLKRIDLSAGPQKHFRVPLETRHLRGDELVFYAVGDRAQVAELLALITHLGRRRAIGLGRVRRWKVDACASWEGFPVLSREGRALRNLPLETAGLREFELGYDRMTYPYWLASDRGELARPPSR